MKTTISTLVLATTMAAVDKVKVSLYYETECPDCRATITGDFADAYREQGFLDMAEITYVPYGKAHTTGEAGDYKFTCQSGVPECHFNIIDACAIAHISDPLKQF